MMFPKPKKAVSKEIRLSAKGEQCNLRIEGVCNNRQSTTVLAHLNSNNKGSGNKSHDFCAVYACSDCHLHLDAGKVSDTDILRALKECQDIMFQKGLIELK